MEKKALNILEVFEEIKRNRALYAYNTTLFQYYEYEIWTEEKQKKAEKARETLGFGKFSIETKEKYEFMQVGDERLLPVYNPTSERCTALAFAKGLIRLRELDKREWIICDEKPISFMQAIERLSGGMPVTTVFVDTKYGYREIINSIKELCEKRKTHQDRIDDYQFMLRSYFLVENEALTHARV